MWANHFRSVTRAVSKNFTPPTLWSPGFLRAHPAFAHLACVSDGLDARDAWPKHEHFNDLLTARGVTSATGARVRAVAQPPRSSRQRDKGRPRPITELYDSRICVLGELPTRERSWHDLFNALTWACFPRSKAVINARQHRSHVERLGAQFTALPNTRSREQDTLAMLDEGSVLLLASARAHDAARAALLDAHHDALAERVRVGEVVPLLFGHALYEHLIANDEDVHAMPVLLAAPGEVSKSASVQRETADGLFASRLGDPTEFTAPNGVSGVSLRRLFDAIRAR